MATIPEILPEFWKGAEWTIEEDDYTTLNWMEGNTLTKPTEEEIRAHSAEVDSLMADRAQRQRQERGLADSTDYLLAAFETIIQALIETKRVLDNVRSTVVVAAHTGSFTTWDSSVVAKVTALQQRLTALRDIP